MTAVPAFSAPASPKGRAGAVLAVPRQAQLEDGENDPILTDCVAALAIIRNSFAAAARQVDADTARFLADCQQLAVEVETG